MQNNSKNKKSSNIVIDVISDFACPWCYVGFMRLQNAMDKFQGMEDVKERNISIEVRWHPYQIDPRTQTNGEPYMDYNRRRWGSDGWVAGMKKTSRPDGCLFENWGNQNPHSVWANTLHSHRLMYFVRKKLGWSKIHDFKRLIFESYYEKGWNISDVNVLIDVGVSGGLDRTELEKYMYSEEGKQEVMWEIKKAKTEDGVNGVPYFTVHDLKVNSSLLNKLSGNSLSSFSGAQATDFWLEIFESFLR